MDLTDFLDRNGISLELLLSEMYTYILCSCLKKACDYLAIEENRISFLSNYRSAANKDKFFFKFAKRVCGNDLTQNEVAWFAKCVMANIKKLPERKKCDTSVINNLVLAQNGKCKICGKSLTRASMHVDHIIPWELVGDELDNNLQLLCKECNLQKSNSLNFQLQSLINIKGGV